MIWTTVIGPVLVMALSVSGAWLLDRRKSSGRAATSDATTLFTALRDEMDRLTAQVHAKDDAIDELRLSGDKCHAESAALRFEVDALKREATRSRRRIAHLTAEVRGA